jgi:hypothetical protein
VKNKEYDKICSHLNLFISKNDVLQIKTKMLKFGQGQVS